MSPTVRKSSHRPRLAISEAHRRGEHDRFVNNCSICKQARERAYARRAKEQSD